MVSAPVDNLLAETHERVAVARLANEFGRHRLRSPVTIHHAVREFTRAWIHESPDIGMMQEPDAVWRELYRALRTP